MWKNLGIVFCIVCLMSGCGTNPAPDKLEFESVLQLKAELISEESPVIGYPYDMFVTDSRIYVLSFNAGKWVHAFDRISGSEIASYVNMGRGPGECLMCSAFHFDRQHGEMYMFDSAQEKLLVFSLEEDGVIFLCEKSFADIEDTAFYRVWPISDRIYLANSQIGSMENGITRFQLYSGDCVLLQECNDAAELEGDDRYTYIHSFLSLSPDRTHLVCVTLMGEILDIYEIAGNSIAGTVGKVFSAPNVLYKGGVVRETESTRWGFPFVASDNEYIYASLADDMDPERYNKIAVFNWKGEGIRKIETDKNVLRLYPYGQDIYAVVADSSNALFFARFREVVSD
ncbi:MAG: BF3164 family lipoprotein [Bacteroidales bacterium]|nr:BF3164 family lipoprotein [Bacteroidales bacterium]